MKVIDIIKISQSNLLRSKLRTFLTVAAVFIGALTISLTNGVGNGVKAYINQELGNVGAEDTLIVQAKQVQHNPLSTDVVDYDPARKDTNFGEFSFTLLTKDDIAKVQNVTGVIAVVPQYNPQLEYIEKNGVKFLGTVTQFIEGLNLQMEAGRTVSLTAINEVTIPLKYVQPLGLRTAANAVGKTVNLAFKDVDENLILKTVTIVGVQRESLLGTSAISIEVPLAEEIHRLQTQGVPALQNSYQAFIVKYDKNINAEQLDNLKKNLSDAGYTALTLQDQIGTVSKVIDTAIVVLNMFGVIVLLAAALGIVNTLLMAVKERVSEIGLMKALGASSRTIFSMFAFEAISIGFWGAILGVAASIGIGSVINRIATNGFLKDFKGFDLLAFPFNDSLLVVLGIMLLAFVVGTLPSFKASRLDPIRALRYE